MNDTPYAVHLKLDGQDTWYDPSTDFAGQEHPLASRY